MHDLDQAVRLAGLCGLQDQVAGLAEVGGGGAGVQSQEKAACSGPVGVALAARLFRRMDWDSASRRDEVGALIGVWIGDVGVRGERAEAWRDGLVAVGLPLVARQLRLAQVRRALVEAHVAETVTHLCVALRHPELELANLLAYSTLVEAALMSHLPLVFGLPGKLFGHRCDDRPIVGVWRLTNSEHGC